MNMLTRYTSALIFVSILVLCGCGDSSDANGNTAPNPAAGTGSQSQVDLATSDLTALSAVSSSGPSQVDAVDNGAFTKIFGGTSGVTIRSFFDLRVHHLVPIDQFSVTPSTFANEKWLLPPTQPAPASSPDPSQTSNPSSNLQVGALNIGSLYWLEGLVNQVSVTMQLGSDSVPLTSSRVGIITFGPGYKTTIHDDSNNTDIPLPAEWRQAILLHEARHSDCTGGISNKTLDQFRNMTDSDETEEQFSVLPCGHLHRVCTSGDYAGLTVCDNEPWGAYTVGSIYALAAKYSATLAGDEQNEFLLNLLYVDQFARVQVDHDQLLQGALGDPDMSHTDYLNQ